MVSPDSGAESVADCQQDLRRRGCRPVHWHSSPAIGRQEQRKAGHRRNRTWWPPKFNCSKSLPNASVLPQSSRVAGEETRLKYRFIDLRREQMQPKRYFCASHHQSMRDYFADHNFIDVETPILVAVRRNLPRLPGTQPRALGQILCVAAIASIVQTNIDGAGYDRYMQFARCFRDEDLRAGSSARVHSVGLENVLRRCRRHHRHHRWPDEGLGQGHSWYRCNYRYRASTYDEAMRRFGHDHLT